MILLIDNYDSFAHNLARYLRRLGQTVEVRRNDEIDVAAIRQLTPAAIVLSPGPCTPSEAGCSLEVVRQFYAELPMLGICLGHQTIAAALGAKIVRAAEPMHGRTSQISNQQSGLFAGLPPQFTVCRYHSLVVENKSLPAELQVTATCDDRTIMAFRHRSHPVFGLQFHPEAILTEHGFSLLNNFLQLAGLSTTPTDQALFDATLFGSKLFDSERCRPAPPRQPHPNQPITF